MKARQLSGQKAQQKLVADREFWEDIYLQDVN